MDDGDDKVELEKFAEEGPRLDRNRGHIRRCHARWLRHQSRPHRVDSPEEWTHQQCGGCRFYIHMTGDFRADWGVCTNGLSPRDGRATFEHDGCDKFAPCDAGWS